MHEFWWSDKPIEGPGQGSNSSLVKVNYSQLWKVTWQIATAAAAQWRNCYVTCLHPMDKHSPIFLILDISWHNTKGIFTFSNLKKDTSSLAKSFEDKASTATRTCSYPLYLFSSKLLTSYIFFIRSINLLLLWEVLVGDSLFLISLVVKLELAFYLSL